MNFCLTLIREGFFGSYQVEGGGKIHPFLNTAPAIFILQIFVEFGPFSGQSLKICSKWLFYFGPNIILEKVKKLQNSSMILREMASNLLSRGHIRPPPAWFRVKFFLFFILLTLNQVGGWSYVPTAQEIACHFSQDHARVLTLLDFFKNDVGPRVKESFWAYLEWLSRKWTEFDKNLQIF